MTPTRQRLHRGVRATRFGALLGAVVLFGAGCPEGADFVHSLFFGTDLPRYGGEREEEMRPSERLLQLKEEEEARTVDEYPGVFLPQDGTSVTGGSQTTTERSPDAGPATVNVETTVGGSAAPLPGIYGQTRRMRVIQYQGFSVPETELITKTEAGCPEPHWHAKNKIQVRTVEGIQFPDTGGCAFGKVKENPVREVDIPLNVIDSARAVN